MNTPPLTFPFAVPSKFKNDLYPGRVLLSTNPLVDSLAPAFVWNAAVFDLIHTRHVDVFVLNGPMLAQLFQLNVGRPIRNPHPLYVPSPNIIRSSIQDFAGYYGPQVNQQLNNPGHRVVWLCDLITRLSDEELVQIFDQLPIGGVLYADMYTQMEKPVNAHGCFQANFCVEGNVPKYATKVNHFERTENIAYWTSGRSRVLNNYVLTWQLVGNVGPKDVYCFVKHLNNAPLRTQPVRSFTQPDDDHKVTFNNLANRAPFSDVKAPGVPIQLEWADYYSYFGLSFLKLNTNKVLLIPSGFINTLKFNMLGTPRTQNTWVNLVTQAKNLYLKSLTLDSDSDLAILVSCYVAFVNVENEIEAVSTINLKDKKKIEDFQKTEVGVNNVRVLPGDRLIAMGMLAAGVGYSLYRHRAVKPASTFVANFIVRKAFDNWKVVTPLLAVCGIGFCLSTVNKFSFDLGIYKFNFSTRSVGEWINNAWKRLMSSKKVFVNNVCAPTQWSWEQMKVEPPDVIELSVNGVPCGEVRGSCTPKPVAVLGGFAVKNRLPVYSCQCMESKLLSLVGRLGLPMPIITSDFLNLYGAALERLHNDLAYTYEMPLAPIGLPQRPSDFITNLDDYDEDVVRTLNRINFRNLSPLKLVSFQHWASRFELSKRTKFIEAHEKYKQGGVLDIKTVCDEFVKFEAYFRHDGELLKPFVPRPICQFEPSYVIHTGPFYYSFGKLLADAFPADYDDEGVFDGGPRHYAYMTGVTTIEAGKWYDEAVKDALNICDRANRVPDKPDDLTFVVIVIEGDFEKFDSHKSALYKATNFAFTRTFIHPTNPTYELLERSVNLKVTTSGKNKLGAISTIKFRVEGKQASGHSNTSTDNTITSYGLLESVYTRLSRITGVRITAETAILGDDNLGVVVLPISPQGIRSVPNDQVDVRGVGVAGIHGDCVDVVLKDLFHGSGMKASIIAHQAFSYKPSFCSGYYFPIRHNGNETLAWVPKLGRLFVKTGFCKDVSGGVDPRHFVRSVFIGYAAVFPHIPIYRSLYRRIMELTEDLKDKPLVKFPDEDFKMSFKVNSVQFSDVVFDAFLSIYNINITDIDDFERYIMRSDFGFLEHPILKTICDVDVPVDTDFVFKENLLAFNYPFNLSPLTLINPLLAMLKISNYCTLTQAPQPEVTQSPQPGINGFLDAYLKQESWGFPKTVGLISSLLSNFADSVPPWLTSLTMFGLAYLSYVHRINDTQWYVLLGAPLLEEGVRRACPWVGDLIWKVEVLEYGWKVFVASNGDLSAFLPQLAYLIVNKYYCHQYRFKTVDFSTAVFRHMLHNFSVLCFDGGVFC